LPINNLLIKKLKEEGVDANSSDLISGTYKDHTSKLTVCCATDGNHGRSVAWGAQQFGCNCEIYIHRNVSSGREKAIAKYGAIVNRIQGNYDDSVRIAAEVADANGYTVVSGSQSWTLTGTFAAGQMPVDNLGGNCPDVQYNGGTDTASVNFEGVYPVYAGNSTQYQGAASGTWTTASVNTTYWTQLSLFSFNSAYFQWNQTYNEDAVAPDVVRHRFAIPSVLTVNDIKKYNSVSGNYDSIPLSQFSTTATTLDVFGNSVAYTIYEKSNSAGGASQYRVYFTD